MAYLLVHNNTGNSIGSYPSKDDALHAVAGTVRRHGADAAESLWLGQYEAGEAGKFIAKAGELVNLVTTDSAVQPTSTNSAATTAPVANTSRATQQGQPGSELGTF